MSRMKRLASQNRVKTNYRKLKNVILAVQMMKRMAILRKKISASRNIRVEKNLKNFCNVLLAVSRMQKLAKITNKKIRAKKNFRAFSNALVAVLRMK